MALRSATILELYLAYLGRPPDAYAMYLYEPFRSSPNRIGPESFSILATSAEYAALSGAHAGNVAALVNDTYNRLFDRDAELAGLIYWASLVQHGTLAIGDLPIAILQSARGAQSSDGVTLANKLAISQTFVNQIDTAFEETEFAGLEAAALARQYILTGPWGDVLDPPGPFLSSIFLTGKAPGVTFTLTSGADAVNPNIGTTLQNTAFGITSSGPDVFEDPLGVTLAPQRFEGDRLDGGGGIDTLRLLNADANTSAAQITSVEFVQASFGATPALLDLSGVPDLQRLELHSTFGEPGFVTVRGMASAVTVEARVVLDSGGLLLQYADRASADQSVTIDLTGSHAVAGGRAAILSVPDIEHITIAVGPDDSAPAGTVLPGIDAAQATTLVLDANAPVTIGDLQLAPGAQVTIESDSMVSTRTSAASMPQCDVLFAGAGVMDAHLDAIASFTSTSSSVVALTVSGSQQLHVAENGTGSINVIFAHVQHAWATGGAQSDSFILTDPRTVAVLAGGGGSDHFTFAGAAPGEDLDALIAAAPSITDWGRAPGQMGDQMHFAQPLHVSAHAVSSPGVASIDTAGIASFDPSDLTLQQKVVAVAAGLQAGDAAGAGAYALFVDGGDTYVFDSAADPATGWGGTALVRLAGVPLDPAHFAVVSGALLAW